MTALDERLAAVRGVRARVVGRVRLQARGCPHLSVGLALLAPADDETPFSILGEAATPVAGERGDERRDRAWALSGTLAEGSSSCDDTTMPTLVLFRATHGADGEIRDLSIVELGLTCTLFGHDLQFGDLDGDHTSEVRVTVRTSDWMDMSAGRDRRETLRIFDVAELRSELEIALGILQADEVDGYGSETMSAEIAMRDVDGDGDRDVVVSRRDETTRRTDDDLDQDFDRSFSYEVYAYDAALDGFRREPTLDARAHPN